MTIFIALATFISTLLGGLFALYFRDRLHLILGFSAGAVIGVAFFDLIPEAIGLAGAAYDPATVMTVTGLGFICYMILDRSVIFHRHSHAEDETEEGSLARGALGAGSLTFHSFLDGLAIGLAFQVSGAVGAVVAIAVLVHDFSDGINTVNLILKNRGSRRRAYRWLIADALAPVLGVAAALFFSLPADVLGLVLAAFAGFFLYIGASDLLPESHHEHPTTWTTVITVIGAAVLYAAIKLAEM